MPRGCEEQLRARRLPCPLVYVTRCSLPSHENLGIKGPLTVSN